MLRLNYFIAGLIVLTTSCKKNLSSQKAIVGDDKALALVGVRNDVSRMNETINVSGKDGRLKPIVNKMNEVRFALVECSAKGDFSADQWMNFIEYISFMGILYLTPERTLSFSLVDSKGQKFDNTPSCELLPAPLLVYPQILGVSQEVLSFPRDESAISAAEKESLIKRYELMQTLFLALRGPWSGPGLDVSPKVIGIVEASSNYPGLSTSSLALGRSFDGADQYFNPCDTSKLPANAALSYLQEWKHVAYSCAEPTGKSQLKNYRAKNYSDIKEKIIQNIATLHAGSKGPLTSNADSATTLEYLLSTAEPWPLLAKDVNHPASKFARYLSGQKSGMGLTDKDTSIHEFFPENAGDKVAGFGLNGLTNSGMIAQGSNSILNVFAQMMRQRFNKGEIKTPNDLRRYESADWASQLANDKEYNVKYEDRYKNSDYPALLEQRFSDLQRVSRDGANSNFLDHYSSYREMSQEAAQSKMYKHANTESGVTVYTNRLGDMMTEGERFANDPSAPAKRDYRSSGTNRWYDETASIYKVGTTSNVNREVAWRRDGTAYQRVTTAPASTPYTVHSGNVSSTTYIETDGSRVTPQGQAAGLPKQQLFDNSSLDFQSDFIPNQPGSSVGRFAMNQNQFFKATGQMHTLVNQVNGDVNTRSSQAAANQSGGLFTNGLRNMGAGLLNMNQAGQAVGQLQNQRRFADDSGAANSLTSMIDASSQQISQDATKKSMESLKTGATQAMGYGASAYQQGGGSLFGAAAVMTKDAFSSWRQQQQPPAATTPPTQNQQTLPDNPFAGGWPTTPTPAPATP